MKFGTTAPRVPTPINEPTMRFDPWRTWPVRVTRSRVDAPCVTTVELAFEDPEVASSYRFAPGQFNMLYVPGVGEAAISIAGRTANQHLQHTIRVVGSVTQAIEAGGVGMPLGLRGPFGTSWPMELMQPPQLVPAATALGGPVGPQHRPADSHEETRDVIVVAGGIGLAPLRALVDHLTRHRPSCGAVSVLIGARTAEDLLYEPEQADWSRAGLDVQRTVDRSSANWKGNVGVVTLLLERLSVPRPRSTLVLTCGPEVMMRYVAQAAMGRGIPEQNIWVTLERNMNCAIGLCGHCQLGPEFICKDGPVFRYDRVSQWLRVQEL